MLPVQDETEERAPLNSKRLAAPARTFSVWVLKLESSPNESVAEIKLQTIQVERTLGVNDALETIILFYHVVRRHIFLQQPRARAKEGYVRWSVICRHVPFWYFRVEAFAQKCKMSTQGHEKVHGVTWFATKEEIKKTVPRLLVSPYSLLNLKIRGGVVRRATQYNGSLT